MLGPAGGGRADGELTPATGVCGNMPIPNACGNPVVNHSVKIQPLWERLPSAFGYGLRSWSLVMALGLGAVTVLLTMLIGVWGLLLAYAVMLKYGFAVLQRSAEGEPDPPELGWSVIGEGYELPFKYYAILFLFLLMLYSVAGKFGPVPALTLMILGMLLLPASTMVLAQTESLVSAINPVLLIEMVGRIGWTYLVLLVFYLLLGTGQSLLTGWVGEADNPYLILFGFFFVATYFIVVSFHMMGYVLLQAHERLGQDAPQALQPDAAEQRMGVFNGFMAEGKTDAAVAELETLLKQTPRDLGLHRRMHNLLLGAQKAEALAIHTRRSAPFLLETGQGSVAAGFYAECSGLSQDCAPRRADCYGRLALALRQRGEGRKAALLVNAFNQQFGKDDANLPEFYLQVARILAEDLNQDEQARRLLDLVMKVHPNHPLLAEVEAYRATLTQLSGR